MPRGSMSDSYPFLFWSGRILFAVGILTIGMALAGRRSIMERGAAGRIGFGLAGAFIATSSLHIVVDMSPQAQVITNAAALLLLLAQVGVGFLYKRRER
jgi:hypothetical protein